MLTTMSRLNKRELERIDLYEILLRGATSPARRRWHLGKLLIWHRNLVSERTKEKK